MDKDNLLKISTQTALAGLLALSLTSCSKPTTPDNMVKCYGVAQGGPTQFVATTAGQCKKLANSKAVPMTDAEAAQAPHYQATDYVKCYGVAAAGMNDCGTKTTACGGTVTTASSKTAWISIPKAICQQVKGGIVGKAK